MKDRNTVRQKLANHLKKKFASGGFRDCGGPGQPPCEDTVVQESKDFVKNWFNDPVTKARYSMNMEQGFGKTLPKIEEGLKNIDSAKIEYNSPTSDSSANAGYRNNTVSFYTKPTESTATHEFAHAMGLDKDLTNYIRKNYGTPAKAIQDKTGLPFEDAIKNQFSIDDSTFVGKNKLQGTINHSRYLSENGELYPRVMEMRKVLNVKPGDVINDEQIETLKTTDNPLFKYYSDGQIKDILNTVASNDNNKQNNTAAAYGGYINQMALGGSKNNGQMNELLSEINTGGSHETNPNGGVPIGKGSTVEQGETMTKDYVFSDRLFLTEPDLKRYNLPKKLKGKSIADASKILAGISKESNAAVDKQTAEDMLERLKGVNEEMKGPVTEEGNPMQQGQQFFLGGNKGAEAATGAVDSAGGVPGMDILGAASTAFEFGNQMFGDTGMDIGGKTQYDDVNVGGQAVGGALKGAQAGMAFGPLGAAVGGVVGGVSGLIGGGKMKNDAEEANHNYAQAQNSKFRQSDFAMGGKKYADGGPKPLNSFLDGVFGIQNPVRPIDATMATPGISANTGLNAMTSTPFDNASVMNRPAATMATFTEDTGRPKTGVGNILDNIGDWTKDKDNQKKMGSMADTAMRYAPVVTNYLQYKNMKKPEYESLNRLDNKYQKDYVDENALLNQAKESESSTRRALKESSGGDMGSLRTNLLASHLNSVKGRSDAFLQADNINRGENRTAQEFNQRTDQINLNQANQENDINARNIAAYDNNRSKLLSSLGEGVGNIGLENQRKKMPERAGLLYDFLGEYLNKNKEKETV